MGLKGIVGRTYFGLRVRGLQKKLDNGITRNDIDTAAGIVRLPVNPYMRAVLSDNDLAQRSYAFFAGWNEDPNFARFDRNLIATLDCGDKSIFRLLFSSEAGLESAFHLFGRWDYQLPLGYAQELIAKVSRNVDQDLLVNFLSVTQPYAVRVLGCPEIPESEKASILGKMNISFKKSGKTPNQHPVLQGMSWTWVPDSEKSNTLSLRPVPKDFILDALVAITHPDCFNNRPEDALNVFNRMDPAKKSGIQVEIRDRYLYINGRIV
jgi:hypothetical protein